MNHRTHKNLKRLLMLSLFGGVIWGSAFAADATSTTAVPVAMQATQTTQAENTQVGQVNKDQQQFTYYDYLVSQRQRAHSQGQANAAIFLSTAPQTNGSQEQMRERPEHMRNDRDQQA
ncbi:MAG: hypothetical protein KHZ77_07880 [Veillonella sp.]|uniref:hypothetical protein n=1 Tax=Veillonella sp. TaxID=1926307 RepID=UPI0025F24355|nr:hypothetical protein [Veillonella sp.]MBS4914051.1 hypothetical protein [Veillonella sp.]